MPATSQNPTLNAKPKFRPLPWVILFVAVAYLLTRGPVRALAGGGSSDFSLIWQSARAWLEGKSPYQLTDLTAVWDSMSGSAAPPPSDRNQALFVYPPSAFPLLAPWAAMPWKAAHITWMISNTVLLLLSAVLAMRAAGVPWRSGWLHIGVGAAAVLAPGHTAISVGQVSILVMFLLSVWAYARTTVDRPRGLASDLAAGAALGAALAIKPQIAGLFLIYELGRLRFVSSLAAIVTAGGLLGLGSWWLKSHGIDWYPQWQQNVDAFRLTDNADASMSNWLRFQLINLHVVFHPFTELFTQSRTVVTALVALSVGLLCAWYLKHDRFKPDHKGEALSLAFVAIISLLVVYHRIYDATVLIFVVAWAMGQLADLKDGMVNRPLAAMAMLAVFLAPGASTLYVASQKVMPSWVINSAIWNGLIIPHATLVLVALAALLCVSRPTAAEQALSRPRGA